jgi:hypothetical protein
MSVRLAVLLHTVACRDVLPNPFAVDVVVAQGSDLDA